jgi:small-conductance mechanosensitive channel
LFASLSIAVDKPFEVGDFIGIDSFVGTVQFIGLKTTRIRSLMASRSSSATPTFSSRW